jgi:hypothetical protein
METSKLRPLRLVPVAGGSARPLGATAQWPGGATHLGRRGSGTGRYHPHWSRTGRYCPHYRPPLEPVGGSAMSTPD